LTVPLIQNEALLVAPTVVTVLGVEPAALVGMLSVIEQLEVGAMLVHVFAVSWNRADKPLSPVSVMATLPSFRIETLVAGAAAPYHTDPRLGAALVSVAVVTGVVLLASKLATRGPDAVSMDTLPGTEPAAVGANCRVTVQELLVAN
jgi:hypothetical protein